MTAKRAELSRFTPGANPGSPDRVGTTRGIPDLPRKRRLMLPSQYPRCWWRYCKFYTGMGMSCKHQLYAAILFESGMPFKTACLVAMRRHRFR